MHRLLPPLMAITFCLSTIVRADVVDVDNIIVPKLEVHAPGARQTGRLSPLGENLIDIDDATAILGKGFDVFSGEVKAEAPCLESDGHDGPTSSDPQKPTGDDWFFNDTFTSIRSFTNASQSGVTFDFTYKIINAKFDESNSTESSTNSSEAFGRFYRRIITHVQFRDGGKWSHDADALLRRSDIKTFLALCGTHYVRAIYWGHSVDQVLHFALKDGSRTSKASADLSVGVKQLISVGAKDDATTKIVSDISTLSHSGHNHGTITGPQLTGDVSSVIAMYQFVTYQFPKAVADSKSNGDILLLDIRPYRERPRLPLIARIPAWPEEIFVKLQGKQDLISDFETAVLDLRYASKLSESDYSALYSAPSYQELKAKLAATDDVKTRLKSAADSCRSLMQSPTTPQADAKARCLSDLDSALEKNDIDSATLIRKLNN